MEKSSQNEFDKFYINRELSWLAFARRVLEFAQDRNMPLLERVKFAGIMGMLYDEFVMKRMGGLHRKMKKNPTKLSADGHTPRQIRDMCWQEMLYQMEIVDKFINEDIRPDLNKVGLRLFHYKELSEEDKNYLREHFETFILPTLTPLAVDIGHPFPFISSLGLNIAVLEIGESGRSRFVRIKVPANRTRWVPLPQNRGFVPLENVIIENLHLIFPAEKSYETAYFRVTRAAKDNPWERKRRQDEATMDEPGSLIGMVTKELSYRKFAGIVRLEISDNMPKRLLKWLIEQLGIHPDMVVSVKSYLGCSDMLNLHVKEKEGLCYPPHNPLHHPRLRGVKANDSEGFFQEIKKGDILIHLPYHNFDTSVLRFIQHAAHDPKVLAIKITIYRTSSESPIIKALMEAVERGKQVAVLVEITARFDEEPNIAWGKMLERAGAHVIYGVERLKTHVKLAMVVREEGDQVNRYVHVGTGNYHAGTARLYEDIGILSCRRGLGEDVGRLFNELTGGIPAQDYTTLLVAPRTMRNRFMQLIQHEVKNALAGKPSSIRAKMNQLQDKEIIDELCRASQAGVEILLNVRGLCCLQAGVKGITENIRVFSILGRFLEHSRIYRFENNGDPIFLVGSADWMSRNLDRRMESIVVVEDEEMKRKLDEVLSIYEKDNTNSWEMQSDGTYYRRTPAEGEESLMAQDIFSRKTIDDPNYPSF